MNIGILGGGQLGRMLALAGYPLGLRFNVYDSVHDAPAGHLAALTVGGFDQYESLDRWAESLDVITYEFENVPVEAAKHLSSRWPVCPPVAALRNSQDRLVEKDFFRKMQVPTPGYQAVDSLDSLRRAIESVGLPVVVKTRTGGYDGKGQRVVRTPSDVEDIVSHFDYDLRDVIVEQFVAFDREVSLIAVRAVSPVESMTVSDTGVGTEPAHDLGTKSSRSTSNQATGSELADTRSAHKDRRRTVGPLRSDHSAAMEAVVRFYPLVENTHSGGILRKTVAPAPDVSQALQSLAESHARRVLEELDYVGVLAIEFFQVGEQLIANEMAPRVHNSGHWTIEGAATSQFENHLRAVAGLPLGSTTARGYSVMLNLIGEAPPLEAMLGLPNVHVHLYGKAARPGRKIGHVTCVGDTAAEAAELARRVQAIIAQDAF